MSVSFGFVLGALWLAWLAYWLISASNVKTVARAENWQSRLAYSAPLWLTAALLIFRGWPFGLGTQVLPSGTAPVFLGLVLTAAGLGIAIWARVHLGANWSGHVTVKEGHELIVSGPYALVRHPIYTGLSLAFLGTAIAIGEARAILALAVAVGSFWYKLQIEERVMLETFGPAYEDYRRKTKALVPFII